MLQYAPTEHVTFLMKYDILWNMIYGVKHFYHEKKNEPSTKKNTKVSRILGKYNMTRKKNS